MIKKINKFGRILFALGAANLVICFVMAIYSLHNYGAQEKAPDWLVVYIGCVGAFVVLGGICMLLKPISPKKTIQSFKNFINDK